MGELNTQVLKGFGIRANKIIREKAYFICDTPDGLRMIYKAQENGERIQYQHEIKEHLIHTGYPWVDRYFESQTGDPFVCVGGELYVMTPFGERREPDFTCWADFARVVEAVAQWQSCARLVVFSGQTRIFAQPLPLTDLYCRQASELTAIRKRISRQARLSDFDVLFIKNADDYTRLIRDAAATLTQTDYRQWHARALKDRHICHNALKEESLPFDGENVLITQYAEACADVQLNDLCGLIRRYTQRVGYEAAPVEKILEAYDRVNPLPRGACDILYGLLQYPYPFMKIVSQYYSKKRTWTPNAIANRMLAIVEEKDTYARYIQAVAP